ncbi:hypothetical protein HDU82_007457 [Entophlyctis luteolus]|nr:hypothetical protein HDU82_007457 [Entophlyctis luteolus]
MDLSDSDLSPEHPQTVPRTLQDADRLAFARSFHRLSQLPVVEKFQQQILVNEKTKSVFMAMCAVVERGVNDALMHKFHVAHGITPPSYDLGSTMNLSAGPFTSICFVTCFLCICQIDPTLPTKSNAALDNSNNTERSNPAVNPAGIPTIGIDGDFGSNARDLKTSDLRQAVAWPV